MRSRDAFKLFLIVLAGVTVRAFTLWVGRVDFTGWLNHTYYYFVQVRGLLVQGSLPYPDMPLLFHLYASIARALIGLGMESDAAVVASTRLVMCLVPALIAVPVYGIIKAINGADTLRKGQWILISAAAFLPLSLGYLPEYSQKNMLGLLLLAILIFYCQKLLRGFSWQDAVISLALMALIVLSHFGTFGALVFFALAVFLAYSMVNGVSKKTLVPALLALVGGGAAMTLIYLLDAQRFRRVFIYLTDSVDNSLVAALILGDRDRTEGLATLAGIIVFYALLFGAYRICMRSDRDLQPADRVFWVANVFF